jgi:polar amino acid transport system permease protein
MTIDPAILLDSWREILAGLGVTLLCWAAGVLLGLVIGIAVAVAQLYLGAVLRAVLRVYIEVIRGTPFLIQLFILYFGGPSMGLYLDPIPAGILGLGIYGGAYFAELFRAGFLSVPRGQLEAADCVGITRWQAIRRIQLPQMLVVIVPSLVNMIIILSKETAVLSIVTVPELAMAVTAIGSRTFAYVPTLGILALAYWALVEGTAWLGRRVEARVGRFMVRAA